MIILNYIGYKNKHFYDTGCIKLPRVPVHCKTAIRAPLILWVMLTDLLLINFTAIMRPRPEADHPSTYCVKLRMRRVITLPSLNMSAFLY
jgi:hypothetical protein